jgi:hypothetical protein
VSPKVIGMFQRCSSVASSSFPSEAYTISRISSVTLTYGFRFSRTASVQGFHLRTLNQGMSRRRVPCSQSPSPLGGHPNCPHLWPGPQSLLQESSRSFQVFRKQRWVIAGASMISAPRFSDDQRLASLLISSEISIDIVGVGAPRCPYKWRGCSTRASTHSSITYR